MKNIFKLLLLGIIFASCEDVEPTIYNGSAENDTFLSFSRTTYFLPVERDATGQVVITLNSSTVSSNDRTYNLEIDQELSTANPLTYNVPATITIPAGSYQGTATLTGQDLDLVEAERKPIYLKISNITNEYIDANQAIINVGEVCTLGAPFVGEYLITQLTQGFPWSGAPSGGDPVFPAGTIVELEMGDSEFERTFTSSGTYAVIGGPGVTFNLSFGCDFIELSNAVVTPIRCGNTAEGNSITFDASDNPSFYDFTDDTQFTLTFSEDSTNACLAPRDTTIQFTKVQ